MTDKIIEGQKLKSAVPALSLGQFFFDYAQKHGDKICQVDGSTDETETYSSVKLRSTRVAIGLQKMGITAKDVVAFCCGNSLDTVIPILGTFYLGAKVANLEPSLSVRLTSHLISLISPNIIFVQEESIGLIEDSLKEINFETKIIVCGHSSKHVTLKKLTEPENKEKGFKPTVVDLKDIAIMYFSSGTTGFPKAICHSHISFMNIIFTSHDYGLVGVLFHFTTFYWITAMFMLTGAFLSGGYRVFCRTLNAQTTFKTIEKYKVNMAFFAPILTLELTNFEHAADYDTSSLHTILSGGTPLSAVQYKKMTSVFKHSKIVQCYGMTEVCCISGFKPEEDLEFTRQKWSSCGTLFPEIKLKISNMETDETLGTNEKGEIRVKTPCLMLGYYNASSDVYDADGFLKTGDTGYYDEDNCLYIVGRTKEMFKYKSWHVVPSFIEDVLLEHPAVKEAVVFGVPWGEDGEAAGACVVTTHNNITTKEIEDFVAKKVSDREKLRAGVTIVSTLPKTPSGKIKRQEIRQTFIESLHIQ